MLNKESAGNIKWIFVAALFIYSSRVSAAAAAEMPGAASDPMQTAWEVYGQAAESVEMPGAASDPMQTAWEVRRQAAGSVEAEPYRRPAGSVEADLYRQPEGNTGSASDSRQPGGNAGSASDGQQPGGNAGSASDSQQPEGSQEGAQGSRPEGSAGTEPGSPEGTAGTGTGSHVQSGSTAGTGPGNQSGSNAGTEPGSGLSGWVETDGQKYYFSSQTGEMLIGWQKIGGREYYFQPETGELQTGLQEIEGDKFYFSKETGEMLTGWQKIGGQKYYFSAEGGEMLTGSQKIGGVYYIFDSAGRLAQSGKARLVTVREKSYCAGKDGKAVSGWQLISGNLYYAAKTGRVKTNASYQGITFTGSGAAKENLNTKLKIEAMQVFSSITTAKMTKSQKLKACWSYVTGGTFRYAMKYPNLNASGWQRKAAYDMLTTHSGNCYSFACAFAALAQEAGYQPYIICGKVRGSRDRAADGFTRHAWVRINGLHYDPEAQYAGWLRGVYGRGSYPVSNQVQGIVAY